jgi:hypothetical protein
MAQARPITEKHLLSYHIPSNFNSIASRFYFFDEHLFSPYEMIYFNYQQQNVGNFCYIRAHGDA